MKNVKPNDWLVTQLENPGFNTSDFQNVGLDANNTQLLSKDNYKTSEFVQQKFTNKEGKFDDVAFDSFYKGIATSYNDLANKDFSKELVKNYEYDALNFSRPTNAKVADIDFSVKKVFNPDQIKTGIAGLNVVGNRELTASELAQKERLFDFKNDKLLDYSPNDEALFSNPFKFATSLFTPQVLAQWDEDGVHTDPLTNRTIKHSKGDYKYNDNGTYYYETLDGRDPIGKQVKSAFDVLTVDGQGINKYDFFDSDGIDKSVTGTIAKNVATLLPLFIPGAGQIYGWGLVGRELATALPMLYNISFGLFDDTENKTLNTIAAIGGGLKQHKSEAGNAGLWNFEAMGDLISDVALQWQQQANVAKFANKLLGTSKVTQGAGVAAAEEYATEAAKVMSKNPNAAGGLLASAKGWTESILGKASIAKNMNAVKDTLLAKNRLAADISLGYMALISNTDTYNTMVQAGVTKPEAAAVAWGAMIGMFGIDKALNLGDLFIDDLEDMDKLSMLAYLKNRVNDSTNIIKKEVTEVGTEKSGTFLTRMFKKGREMGTQAKNKFAEDLKNHTLTLTGKAFGEGLEEVGEELVTDVVKQTYEWMSAYGYTPTKKVDVGAFDNMLERYTASFVGGAIGGLTFGLKDLAVNGTKTKKETEELSYLIRNGKTQEILDELEIWRKKGKLGNTTLSASKTTTDENGNKVYITAQEDTDSQNEAIYNIIKSEIQSLDAVINQTGMKVSDEDLLETMVLKEQSLMELAKKDYTNKYFQDFNTLTDDIVSLQTELAKAETGSENPTDREKANAEKLGTTESEDVKRIQEKLNEKYAERDEFLQGKKSLYYSKLLVFGVNDAVNTPFFNSTFNQYVAFKTGKQVGDPELTEAELNKLKNDYKQYKATGQSKDLRNAFDLFESANAFVSPLLEENAKSYHKIHELNKFMRKSFYDENGQLKEQFKLQVNLPNTEENLEANLEIDEKNAKIAENINQFIDKLSSEVGYADDKTIDTIKQAIYFNKADLENFHLNTFLNNISDILPVNSKNRFILELSKLIKEDKWEEAYGVIVDKTQASKDLKAALQAANLNIEAKRLAILIYRTTGLSGYVDTETFDIDIQQASYPEIIKVLSEAKIPMEMIQNAEEEAEVNKVIGIMKSVTTKAYNEAKNNLKPFQDAYLQAKSSDASLQALISLEQKVTNIYSNPLIELMKGLSTSMLGHQSNLIDLLKQEKTRLRENSVDEYLLSADRINELKEAKHILETLGSVIYAADTAEMGYDKPYGHNQVINDFIKNHRAETDGAEPYGVISSDIATSMMQELTQLESEINALIALSEKNGVNKFAQNKTTGKAILTAKLNFLKNNEKLLNLTVAGIPLLNKDKILALNPTENDNILSIMTEIEDEMFDNFQKMIVSKGNIKDVLNALDLKSAFDYVDEAGNKGNILYGQVTSNLNSSSFNRLSSYDSFIYLLTSLSLKSSDFNYHLKSSITGNDEFAPLPSQELGIKTALATILSPEIFQHAVDNMFNSMDPKEKKAAAALSNVIFCDGIGGSGKTTAVGGYVYKILQLIKPNCQCRVLSINQSHADNLTKSLSRFGFDEATKAVISDDLGKLFLADEKIEPKIRNANISEEEKKNKTKTGQLYEEDTIVVKNGSRNIKVLFIDEGTHIPIHQWQILNKYARENGIQIVSFGDTFQNGVGVTKGNIDNDVAVTIRTPKFGISMRDNNIQKQDNQDILLSKLSQIDEIRLHNVGADIINQEIIKANTTTFTLKYYEDDKVMHGEKLIKSGELNINFIKKLIDEGKTVGYVYDNANSELYKKLQGIDGITLISGVKSMQGQEFDYFISDVNLSLPATTDGLVINAWIRNLYTISSRAKTGTFIVNDTFTDNVNITNKQEQTTSSTPDRKIAIKSYKEDLLKTLEEIIPENYKPTEYKLFSDGKVEKKEAEDKSQEKITLRSDIIKKIEELLNSDDGVRFFTKDYIDINSLTTQEELEEFLDFVENIIPSYLQFEEEIKTNLKSDDLNKLETLRQLVADTFVAESEAMKSHLIEIDEKIAEIQATKNQEEKQKLYAEQLESRKVAIKNKIKAFPKDSIDKIKFNEDVDNAVNFNDLANIENEMNSIKEELKKAKEPKKAVTTLENTPLNAITSERVEEILDIEQTYQDKNNLQQPTIEVELGTTINNPIKEEQKLDYRVYGEWTVSGVTPTSDGKYEVKAPFGDIGMFSNKEESISDIEYNARVRLLMEIKNDLLYTGKLSKSTIKSLLNRGIKYTDFKYGILIRPKDSIRDSILKSNSTMSGFSDKENISITLIFGSENKYITLGVLANPYTAAQATGSQQDDMLFNKLKNTFDGVNAKIYPLEEDEVIISGFTDLKKQETPLTIEELQAQCGNKFSISPVYISGIPGDKHNSFIYVGPKNIKSTDLIDVHTKTKDEVKNPFYPTNSKASVRKIIISPTYLTFQQLYNQTIMEEENTSEENNTQVVSSVDTAYTSAQMLICLWNRRAELLNLNPSELVGFRDKVTSDCNVGAEIQLNFLENLFKVFSKVYDNLPSDPKSMIEGENRIKVVAGLLNKGDGLVALDGKKYEALPDGNIKVLFNYICHIGKVTDMFQQDKLIALKDKDGNSILLGVTHLFNYKDVLYKPIHLSPMLESIFSNGYFTKGYKYNPRKVYTDGTNNLIYVGSANSKLLTVNVVPQLPVFNLRVNFKADTECSAFGNQKPSKEQIKLKAEENWNNTLSDIKKVFANSPELMTSAIENYNSIILTTTDDQKADVDFMSNLFNQVLANFKTNTLIELNGNIDYFFGFDVNKNSKGTLKELIVNKYANDFGIKDLSEIKELSRNNDLFTVILTNGKEYTFKADNLKITDIKNSILLPVAEVNFDEVISNFLDQVKEDEANNIFDEEGIFESVDKLIKDYLPEVNDENLKVLAVSSHNQLIPQEARDAINELISNIEIKKREPLCPI